MISVSEVSSPNLNILRAEGTDGLTSAWRWKGPEIRESLTVGTAQAEVRCPSRNVLGKYTLPGRGIIQNKWKEVKRDCLVSHAELSLAGALSPFLGPMVTPPDGPQRLMLRCLYLIVRCWGRDAASVTGGVE